MDFEPPPAALLRRADAPGAARAVGDRDRLSPGLQQLVAFQHGVSPEVRPQPVRAAPAADDVDGVGRGWARRAGRPNLLFAVRASRAGARHGLLAALRLPLRSCAWDQAASALVRGRDFAPRLPFTGVPQTRRGSMPGAAALFLFLSVASARFTPTSGPALPGARA